MNDTIGCDNCGFPILQDASTCPFCLTGQSGIATDIGVEVPTKRSAVPLFIAAGIALAGVYFSRKK